MRFLLSCFLVLSILGTPVFAEVSVKSDDLIGLPVFNGGINGFRGYKWGDPPSILGKTEIVKDNNRRKFLSVYKKLNDSLKFGNAKADRIEYSFYKNGLFRVDVFFSNSKCRQSLYGGLLKKYGQYFDQCEFADNVMNTEHQLDIHRWVGKEIGRAILYYDDTKKSGYLTIYNNKILDEVTAQEESAADVDL